MKWFKESERVSMSDIFAGFDVSDEPYEKTVVSARLKALLKFFVLTIVTGLVASVGPIVGLGFGVQAAEPAITLWNKIDDTLPPVSIAERNTLLDKNGTPFAQIWTEDRVPVKSLNDISTYAKKGLIDTEDKRFYETKGFDVKGTLRAALTGHGGGSGITQQLIKNLQFYNLLGKSNKDEAVAESYTRKIRELKISIQYEKTHSKDDILLSYFNTVAFGGPNIYGIDTASKYYFGKSSKDLTIAQAAVLVGSAQNPSLFNLSSSNPSTISSYKKRQSVVLDRMVAQGDITAKQADQARTENLAFVAKRGDGGGNCYSSKYPMYCRYVLDYLLKSPRLGSTVQERQDLLAKGGLQIHTYMDPKAMAIAEDRLKKGYGVTNRIVAPTAIVEPGTGGVLAIAQNRDWGYSKGQTTYVLPNVKSGEGSVYKIFTLAAALNSGLTPSDLAFASESCPLYPGPNYDAPPNGFKNSNSCEMQGGFLTFKQAIAYSSNTWFVTLEKRIGVNAVKKFSSSVGLAAPDYIGPRSLSYTLGSVENTPLQIATAAATFANKGVYCPATPVQSMTYMDGTEPATPDNYDPSTDACHAVMSPHNAGIVLQAMRANVSGEIPNAFGRKAHIDGYDTVGKSGTNEDLNTTWLQMSQRYAIFTNVYDLDHPARGIDGVMFDGEEHGWEENTATLAASSILKSILAGTKNVTMDYNDSNTDIQNLPVDESSFATVPSVLGMEPSAAVQTMINAGFNPHVSLDEKKTPSGFQAGTIVDQSYTPGQRIAKGKTREITLYIGK